MESLRRRVRRLRPVSIRRIFSSRVPNRDSMPRVICTLDFIRGSKEVSQKGVLRRDRTSAGAEAGLTSTPRISEKSAGCGTDECVDRVVGIGSKLGRFPPVLENMAAGLLNAAFPV